MLEVRGLSKSYRRKRVLTDISLSVPEGHTFALLGPNGSGKTTLLKCLMGSVLPDGGELIELCGERDVNSVAYREKIVYLPQAPRFLPHLSAGEIIALLVRLRGCPASRLERLAEELHVNEFWDKPFGELSGGMKQKINILQCFMFDFRVAFLDEPTASLDPQIAHYLKSLIRELRDEGRAIVFTSHIMSEVEEIADSMALLVDGHIYLRAEPGNFVREKGTRNLEEALLAYWGKRAS